MITFKPELKIIGEVEGLTKPLDIAALAAEPSLFSCSVEHALKHGGPLTARVLKALEDNPDIKAGIAEGLHPIIDVRVQRLMPGMYPSIPGWHCDAVPRPNYHTQPDFSLIHPKSTHFTLICSTAEDSVSATEFLDEEIVVPFNKDLPVWQQLHRHISKRPGLKTASVKNGQLAQFSTLTPHRTMPTTTRGWRIFFRLSLYHNPPIANGIPSQQQVYILSEENGW